MRLTRAYNLLPNSKLSLRFKACLLSASVPTESNVYSHGVPPQYGYQPAYPTSHSGFQPTGYVAPAQPMSGYAPAQPMSGYAPAQPMPGYGPSGYAGYQPPPPQYPQGPTSQQQQSSNVVVVGGQPSAATTTVVHRSTGDHFLTVSVVLTILCVVCGGWGSLLCTIPAIVVASAILQSALLIRSMFVP
ncbi:hypothetical protein EMCRGX_G011479 [Ephydatia muelleri]